MFYLVVFETVEKAISAAKDWAEWLSEEQQQNTGEGWIH
jgi:hypothetical protein